MLAVWSSVLLSSVPPYSVQYRFLFPSFSQFPIGVRVGNLCIVSIRGYLLVCWLIASQTDFRDFKTDISLEACETRRCVNVEIVDDSINEGDETLYVTLTTTPNLTYRIQFHPQAAKFRIIDNNGMLPIYLLTFGTHTQRGLQYFVRKCVCPSVHLSVRPFICLSVCLSLCYHVFCHHVQEIGPSINGTAHSQFAEGLHFSAFMFSKSTQAMGFKNFRFVYCIVLSPTSS